MVVDFTWLFYTEIMIRIKNNTKSNIKRKGMYMRKRRIAAGLLAGVLVIGGQQVWAATTH